MKMFKINGIKCDTPNCGYSDMTVKSSDYHNWLNKPCPKCSANLLTQKDYDIVQKMESINNFKIVRLITFIELSIRKILGLKLYNMKAEMNGTGKIVIKHNTDSK